MRVCQSQTFDFTHIEHLDVIIGAGSIISTREVSFFLTFITINILNKKKKEVQKLRETNVRKKCDFCLEKKKREFGCDKTNDQNIPNTIYTY